MDSDSQSQDFPSSPGSESFAGDDGDAQPVLKYSYNKNKNKKPRRNKSAFILFSIETRAKLKAQLGEDINSNEMMVRLAEKWKNLDKDEKNRFQTEAKLDKERYQKELDAFWKENPQELIQNRTKKNHVKKPCSAYALYLKEVKEEIKKDNPKMKMADVLKIVSERWKQLNSQEKAKYNEIAEKEKQIARAKLGEKYKQNEVNSEAVIKKKRARQKNDIRKQLKKENGDAVTITSPNEPSSPIQKVEFERPPENITTPTTISPEPNKNVFNGLLNKEPLMSPFYPFTGLNNHIDPQLLMQIARNAQHQHQQNNFNMNMNHSQQPFQSREQQSFQHMKPPMEVQHKPQELPSTRTTILQSYPNFNKDNNNMTYPQLNNHNGMGAEPHILTPIAKSAQQLAREAILAQIQNDSQLQNISIPQQTTTNPRLENKKSLLPITTNLFPNDQKDDKGASELMMLFDKSVKSSSELLIDLLNFDSNPGKLESAKLFSTNSLTAFTSTLDIANLGSNNNKGKTFSRANVLNNAILSALDFAPLDGLNPEGEDSSNNAFFNLSLLNK